MSESPVSWNILHPSRLLESYRRSNSDHDPLRNLSPNRPQAPIARLPKHSALPQTTRVAATCSQFRPKPKSSKGSSHHSTLHSSPR